MQLKRCQVQKYECNGIIFTGISMIYVGSQKKAKGRRQKRAAKKRVARYILAA